MTNTTNYELNIVEGNDKVNPLTQLNPNFEIIDGQMKENSNAGVQSATELTTGTVHALTRLQGDAPVFRFTATSRFTAGDTFTVDGVQVSALTTSGEQLPDGAYVIGAEVLCNLKGSVLTVYCSMNTVANAVNSQKLGGQSADYYATAEAVEQAQETATSAGTLASQNAQNINTINTNLDKLPYTSINGNTVDISQYNTVNNPYTLPSDGFIRLSCTIATTSAKATLHVMVDNGSWLILSRAIANGSDSVDTLNYFPKGTKVYIDGANYNGLFIPVNK